MKIRIPMMVQDAMVTSYKEMNEHIEEVEIEEEFFLDGPVSKRVAVLDFDSKTGELLAGARFQPPPEDRKLGHYEIANKDDIQAHDFNQVSVFATVLKTMYLFEDEDTLGRPLVWGFDAPQLLVVPRAGEWANAFYERESHSLQFFYFPALRGGRMIYTSLSRDIIAHETGHAILDGIAPDLYNALTPQSLALHEAIADLTALLSAFSSRKLRDTVLKQTGSSINEVTAFSEIAEEFGNASDPECRATSLRSLVNKKTLDSKDTSRDELDRPNRVARNEPHELSEVLSGALYTLMSRLYEKLKQKYHSPDKALPVAAEQFKRMIFRALDYLPPGEISFTDYGHALIAADQAAHPDDREEREWVSREFVHRHMAPNLTALKVKTNFEEKALKDLDIQTLVDSDWAAYEFANRNRKLLHIPDSIHFRVRPRLDVTKLYYHREGEERIRECLFKVSWDYKEPNRLGPSFPRERQITVGTTLAIDWKTKKIRALLTSDPGEKRQEDREQQQEDRDAMFQRLIDDSILQVGSRAVGPDGKLLRSAIRAETMNGLMRVRGAARMLHIT
jgi:hypothetical protein